MIPKKGSQKISEVPTRKSILKAWYLAQEGLQSRAVGVQQQRVGNVPLFRRHGLTLWLIPARNRQDNENHIKDSRTYPFITQILFCSLLGYKVILIFQLIWNILEYKLNASIPRGVSIYWMYGVCPVPEGTFYTMNLNGFPPPLLEQMLTISTMMSEKARSLKDPRS